MSPKPKIRKVTRVGKRSLCVVIPSTMIEELGWDDHHEVEVSMSKRSNRVVIRDAKTKVN